MICLLENNPADCHRKKGWKRNLAHKAKYFRLFRSHNLWLSLFCFHVHSDKMTLHGLPRPLSRGLREVRRSWQASERDFGERKLSINIFIARSWNRVVVPRNFEQSRTSNPIEDSQLLRDISPRRAKAIKFYSFFSHSLSKPRIKGEIIIHPFWQFSHYFIIGVVLCRLAFFVRSNRHKLFRSVNKVFVPFDENNFFLQ